jgi:predicted nuclease of restriction endonuclease-like RecB superfamily
MSIQLNVSVEVTASEMPSNSTMIRYSHAETVIPETIEDSAQDHADLLLAVFDRVQEEARKTLTEQINQVASMLASINDT